MQSPPGVAPAGQVESHAYAGPGHAVPIDDHLSDVNPDLEVPLPLRGHVLVPSSRLFLDAERAGHCIRRAREAGHERIGDLDELQVRPIGEVPQDPAVHPLRPERVLLVVGLESIVSDDVRDQDRGQHSF